MLHPKLLIKNKRFWSITSTTLLLIFAFWFLTSVTPVLLVEARYQYKKALEENFQVTSITELIFPNFDFFDFRGRTKNREYGIVIPAIYLDEPVVFNVDPNEEKEYKKSLRKGIAHASSTAFPDNGGLGYYFAHSSNPDPTIQRNAIFYLLAKLVPGDSVFIWHEGERYEYLVTKQEINQPGDTSFLYDKKYNRESIVLQTCWPAGTTKERMLVFAERID